MWGGQVISLVGHKGLSINDVSFAGRGGPAYLVSQKWRHLLLVTFFGGWISQKVTKSDGGGGFGLFSKPKVT